MQKKQNLISPFCTMSDKDCRAEVIGAIDEDAGTDDSDLDDIVRAAETEAEDEEVERAVIEMDGDDKSGIREEAFEDEGDLGNEEIKAPRFMRRPGHPSKADREAHDALHVNYRSWCRYCTMGKGQHRPHQSKSTRQRGRTRLRTRDEADGEDNEGIDKKDEHEGPEYPMISMD